MGAGTKFCCSIFQTLFAVQMSKEKIALWLREDYLVIRAKIYLEDLNLNWKMEEAWEEDRSHRVLIRPLQLDY